MHILAGFASKETYAHDKIIIASTPLAPIATDRERRAAVPASFDSALDVFVKACHNHTAVVLDERGNFTKSDPLSMLLARTD